MNRLKTKYVLFILFSVILFACQPKITTKIRPGSNKPKPNYVKNVQLNLEQNGPFISGKIQVTFTNQTSKTVKGNYHFSIPENSILRNYKVVTTDHSLISTLEPGSYVSDIYHSKGMVEIAKNGSNTLSTNGWGYFKIVTNPLPPKSSRSMTIIFHSLAESRGGRSGIHWKFSQRRGTMTTVRISTAATSNWDITDVRPDSIKSIFVEHHYFHGKLMDLNIAFQPSEFSPLKIKTGNGDYPAYIIPAGSTIFDSLSFQPQNLFEFYPTYMVGWQWLDTLITKSKSGKHAPFFSIPLELSSRNKFSQPFIQYLIQSKHIPIFQDITITKKRHEYSPNTSFWMHLDNKYLIFYDPDYLILPAPLWAQISGQTELIIEASSNISAAFETYLKYNTILLADSSEQTSPTTFPSWKNEQFPEIQSPKEKILWSQKQKHAKRRPEKPNECGFYDSAPAIVGGQDSLNKHLQILPYSIPQNPVGVVLIQVHVLRDSSIAELVPIEKSPDPMLTLSAMQAIRSVRFAPATQHGRPLDTWFTVPVMFKKEDYAQLSGVPDKIYHFFDRSFVIASLEGKKLLVEKGIDIRQAETIAYQSDAYFQLLYNQPDLIKYCYYAQNIGLRSEDGKSILITS